MTNPFAAYADQVIPRAVKKRTAKKVEREAERIKRVQDDDAILAKQARAMEKVWRAEAIDRCEDPAAMRSILDWLKRSGPDDGEATIEMMTQAAQTFKGREARYLLTKAVREASQRIRRKLDLPPIDDPLPPETNVFLECREILR